MSSLFLELCSLGFDSGNPVLHPYDLSFQKTDRNSIRLMKKTNLHHLKCPKRSWYWYKTNIWGILSGAGFFPLTLSSVENKQNWKVLLCQKMKVVFQWTITYQEENHRFKSAIDQNWYVIVPRRVVFHPPCFSLFCFLLWLFHQLWYSQPASAHTAGQMPWRTMHGWFPSEYRI